MLTCDSVCLGGFHAVFWPALLHFNGYLSLWSLLHCDWINFWI